MENIPTPPEFKDTFNEVANKFMDTKQNQYLVFIHILHELKIHNFYMAEIEASLRSMANDK